MSRGDVDVSAWMAAEVEALRAAFFREIGLLAMQLIRIENQVNLLAQDLLPEKRASGGGGNGRRTGLKSRGPKGNGGSRPPSRTKGKR